MFLYGIAYSVDFDQTDLKAIGYSGTALDELSNYCDFHMTFIIKVQ